MPFIAESKFNITIRFNKRIPRDDSYTDWIKLFDYQFPVLSGNWVEVSGESGMNLFNRDDIAYIELEYIKPDDD